MTRELISADLFCGAGGTSEGAEDSGAARVVCAVNHWDVAIQTHAANFPLARHIHSRLDQVNPAECPRIDLLFASPECTHHSRARGGRPTSDQQRAGAWDLMRWIEHHRPSWIVVENVAEFREWGPVGDHGRPLPKFRGRFFGAWLAAIESAGYRVDCRLLNAADFGAATSRERLFVVARKGNRSISWPEPTHAANIGGELPGFRLLPWRSASEILDWSIPCPSIFSRSRPLADNTLLRIEAGLRKFVGPFVCGCGARDGQSPPSELTRPINTIVTKDAKCLAVPYQVRLRNHADAAELGEPVGCVTANGHHHGLAMPLIASTHFGGTYSPVDDKPCPTIRTRNGALLAVPFLADVNYGHGGETNGRCSELCEPIKTITAHNGKSLVVPWLSSFYGNDTMSGAAKPVPTITTKDRHSLCLALCSGPEDWPAAATDAMRTLQVTMRQLGVADIGFRMLQNRELSAAQGFPASYQFHGNKSQITRQIGNSVCPPVAKAITLAIAGV
jgi:DNA (cytosine-5)-methyltransferase 1